ncbi:MAG TPA: carboxylesterase family protein [Microlunatus sp.]
MVPLPGGSALDEERMTVTSRQNGPIYHPPVGPIQGWVDDSVGRATGIVYATAERFRAPHAVPDWTDAYAATTWSPACPQNRSQLIDYMCGGDGLDDLGQDEHCQRLSITMPVDAQPDERLPVMVWVHGGSYVTGAGDSSLTDPAGLVAEQRVVAVAVTYRLGLFGYLGDDDRPANLGLLDQLEAFRWVRRNIAAFSGDPDNITAFGESAGADAVVHLMASANGEPLFRRAIIQSAPLGILTGRQRMNAAMTRGARHLTADLAAAEILASQQRLARASARFGLRGGMPFGVQYGRPPLPPEDQIETALNKAAEIPVLIGTNADETSFFTSTVPPIAALSHWPVGGQALARAIVRRSTAAVYGAATDQFARRHAQAGGTAHRYHLTWSAAGNRFGSTHGIDVALLFGTEEFWGDAAMLVGASWDEIDEAGSAVRALWADFARGIALPAHLEIPGVLTLDRLGPGQGP